jgi:hypothetical protein
MNREVDRAGSVPVMVAAGLERCRRERTRLQAAYPASDVGWAARAERLAVLHEREARWWTVLDRWTFLSQREIPTVFGDAAMIAAGQARASAGFWRDSAGDWRRRVAGQPVCSAVGCGCGGVCEVRA